VQYIQRREYYRAAVPMEKHVPVQFATPTGTLLNAELRDISLGGFGARLRGTLTEPLEPGHVIERLVITLPTKSRINGSGQICYSEPVRTALASRCGIRFMHVDKTDFIALQHFIAQLDREMKRKHLG
jgi:c-di-GMP-binding flagellar brake protein YcgR